MGPAKPDHGGLHLSATRVDTFKKCERKWAFEYIARIPYEPSPWLAFGTLFHAHLETYFKTGALPDLSWIIKTLNKRNPYIPTDNEIAAKLAAFSLKEWPKYEPGRFVPEREFSYAMPWGIFTGSVDLPDLRIRRIGDHKTTSSLVWAPTVDELLTWPQPVAYSYHTARELGWAESDCRWVYSEKGTYRLQVVQTPMMPFSYWEDQWNAGFVGATKAMAELYAQGADPLELSPAADTSYCHAYGGCPFRHLCKDVDHSASLLTGFDGDSEMSAGTSEVDALLGTGPDVPEPEVGNTATTEAPADLSALDDLLNPPAGGGQAAVASKAPPLADPKPSPETVSKAAAENAAKPPKKTKAKSSATPEGAAALADLKKANEPIVDTTAKTLPEPEIVHAIPGAEHKTIPAPQVAAPSEEQAATAMAFEAMAQASALLVGAYLDPQNFLGKSGPAAVGAVQGLAAQGLTDNALIIRAIPVILTLRKAFGDA